MTEGVTGSAAQILDSQQSSNRADQIVLLATFALILILLLVIFRSPIIALLPLILIALVSQVAGVVIVAFLALTLSTLSVLRAIGPALAIAVATTLVAGLTLVPAVVSLLGTRVFWPSRAWRKEPGAARFAAIGRALGRHPAWFATVSGLVLAGLTVGAFSYHPTFDLSSAGIPNTAESQTALKTLEKGLPPGATDPTDVFLQSKSGQPLTTAQLAVYGARLKTLDGVGAVAPPKLSADQATAPPARS